MSEALGVIITDTHLSESNIPLIESIFDQAMDEAEALGLKEVWHDGDLFTSRKGQSLAVSKCLIRILRKFESRSMLLRIHPGNHDKTDYQSEDSFLDIFERYTSLHLVRTYDHFTIGKCTIHMIPFFDEALIYPKYLKMAHKNLGKGSNVLLTHIAVDGVQNNDGSEIENNLTSAAFDVFDLVLVGHYHNYQEIDNVVYIGSTHQHNFGEDIEKGMTILYDDLTFIQKPFKNVPVYRTNKIDLNKVTDKELKGILKEIESSPNFEKIKFTGSLERITAVKKLSGELSTKGIKVERIIDNAEIQVTTNAQLMEFKGFDVTAILDEFDRFATNKSLPKKQAQQHKTKLKNILVK